MVGDDHRFLASFRIECSDEYERGILISLPKQHAVGQTGVSMRRFRNARGRRYEENHLEEWVARCPEALFPNRKVLLLASQNYAHLPEKIDLLFVDEQRVFSIVEAKVERVARNNGVTHYEISQQMGRYTEFALGELPRFPVSHRAYYGRFITQFRGTPRGEEALDEDLKAAFGANFVSAPFSVPLVHQVYLTEGYDEDAVERFRVEAAAGKHHIRLTYYRFFPRANEPNGDYIEFWEVPLDAGVASATPKRAGV